MKNVRLVFGCVLGVLLAAGLIVAAGLSKQETKSWQKIDIKSQVRNGRLYALKTFLNNYGIDDVRAKRNMFGLKELLGDYRSQNRLLFIADNRLTGSEDAEELLSWVGRGNHVVIAMPSRASDNQAGTRSADEEPNFRQTILRNLQIATAKAPEVDVKALPDLPACVKAAEQRTLAAKQIGNLIKAEVDKSCNAVLSSIRLPEGATLNIHASYSFHDDAVWVPQETDSVMFQGKNAYGTQIIRVRYGDGSVLLTWDEDWLVNPDAPDRASNGLNLYDHAYLAAYLAQGKSEILLVDRLYPRNYGSPEPVLWKMLKAQPALWGIAFAAGAALLWRIVVRVGVVRRLPPAPERYLKQHLLAQGQFLSRNLSRRAILNEMQHKLLDALQQRHPAWKQMPAAKRLAFLCAQTKLPPSVVEPWLRPLPEKIRIAKWLQLLTAHQRIMRKINRS